MGHMTTCPAMPSHCCTGCGRDAWRLLTATHFNTPFPLCRECALDAIVALAAALRHEEAQTMENDSAHESMMECINSDCGWTGPRSETVHPKHDKTMLCCPECHEIVEQQ
jgi:hypothetical protein